MNSAFKARLLDTLLYRDYPRVSAVHSGEWLHRLTSDAVVAANDCVEIVPGLAGMVVKLVSALCMIVAMEPRFAAILLPGGALLVAMTWLFGVCSSASTRRCRKRTDACASSCRSVLPPC